MSKCTWRIVASWLPYDIECIRDEHNRGAHVTRDGKVFHIKNEAKPPPLPAPRKLVVRVRRG